MHLPANGTRPLEKMGVARAVLRARGAGVLEHKAQQRARASTRCNSARDSGSIACAVCRITRDSGVIACRMRTSVQQHKACTGSQII